MGDVSVGFICDSCKVKAPSASARKKAAPPPVEVAPELNEALVGLLAGQLAVEVVEEVEKPAEVAAVAVEEEKPAAEVKKPAKKEAAPEPPPAKETKTKGAEPATTLGKALVQALTDEKPKKSPKKKE